MTNQGNSVSVQAPGTLIDDNKTNWTVDFSEYIKARPEYTLYNNLVQTINNAECLYAKGSAKDTDK